MSDNLEPTREKELAPGEHRFHGTSFQEVLEADGDRDVQPASYKLQSPKFLGDEPIPFERYLSREFFDLEMSEMWSRTWQWACREEHIPEVGDYYVYDIGPHSLIVVRTESGVKAYRNSCLHRGTKLKPSFSDGHCSKFSCPFHGWTWTIDGELSHIPCDWDFPHVTKANSKLPEVRVGHWGGFIFINLDPDAMSLEEYLAPLPELAAHAELENRYVALHIEKELDCNWKIAQEAFSESYHGLVTHPETARSNSVSNSQYDIFGPHVGRFTVNLARADELLPPLTDEEVLGDIVMGGDNKFDVERKVPEGSTPRQLMADYFREAFKDRVIDYSNRSISEIIDVVGYLVFPNQAFFMSPTLGTVHRIRPLGNDHTRALFELISIMPCKKGERPEPAAPIRLKVDELYTSVEGMDKTLAIVYDQDTSNMRWQQEGMAASATGAERLGNYQEVLIRMVHQQIDRYISGKVKG